MAVAERITGAQQENLLTLLAHDDKHGKIIAQSINPELFEGEYREFAERFVRYWKKYKKAPGVHAADLFSDVIEDKQNRKRKTYERILRNMSQMIDGVNVDYVMQTLRTFTRGQTMKDAVLKAAEKLNEDKDTSINEVEIMFAELLRAREHQFNAGLSLLDVDRVMRYLETHYSEFRTGIAPLDRRNIGPTRGGVLLWLAPTGLGKSWALGHCGKHALLQRLKVLHVTLEMAEEESAMRYYQQLFSISKRKEIVRVPKLLYHKNKPMLFRDVGADQKIVPAFAFEDWSARRRLKREIEPWQVRIPFLRIKQFPPRSLTIDGLRAYLDALEAVEGFVPDMIILDYVGIMYTDPKNHRITQGRVMEEFRALCIERNAAGVTAAQVNRAGAKADLVRATHAAEDWSLIQTADVAITYSQTLAEKRHGLARLFVDKARSEADKFGMVITQAYPIGQFALQAAKLSRAYVQYLEDIGAEDDDELDED